MCLCVCVCVSRSAGVKRHADMLTDSRKRIFFLWTSEKLIQDQCPPSFSLSLSMSLFPSLSLSDCTSVLQSAVALQIELQETLRTFAASSTNKAQVSDGTFSCLACVLSLEKCSDGLHCRVFALFRKG